MKTLARRMLLTLGLLAAIAGCGRQDRYEIVGPPLQDQALGGEWARITPLHLPSTSNTAPRALAAWATGDYLMSLNWGEVYRVQGAHYLPQEWPGADTVVGLVIRPDGLVRGLDWAGQIGSLEGGAWNLETDLTDGTGFRGLLEDDQGRLTAFGQSGLLWRETESGWESLSTDPDQHFVDAWAAPGQGTFLVTDKLEVFQLTADGVELLVRLGQNNISSHPRIEGDGSGRLAVCDPNRRELWALDGGPWLLVEDDLAIVDIFWLAGRLHALPSFPRQILRLEQGLWQTVADVPDHYSLDDVRSVGLSEGRLIGCRSAGVLFFADEQLEQVSPPLGPLTGLIDYQGQMHALLLQGAHLVSTGTGWQFLGQPLRGTAPLGPATLKIDPAGHLMFLGSNFIKTWDGTNYQNYEDESSFWNNAFYQPDGSIFLSNFGGDWTLFLEGEFTEVPHYQENWDRLKGAVLGPDGSGWVADDTRLGRLDRGQIQTELLVQNWRINGLTHDPVRGTMAFGSGRVLALNDPDYQDITPFILGDDDPLGVSIEFLFPDGRGGLVAWDSEHDLLLYHDGESWTYQTVPGNLFWWGGTTLSPNPDGSFYLWDHGVRLVRVERAASP